MELIDGFTVFNVVRVFTIVTLAFFVSILLTPLWTKVLLRFRMGKQLRSATSAPIAHGLHKEKEGTPTAAGVIIWVTVSILTLLFWYASLIFGSDDTSLWYKFNFFSRGETWLPLGTLVMAGFLGFADDILGVLKIGPNGGGMSMKHRIVLYTLVAIVGAWWFYSKLEFSSINVPFLGNFDVGWLYVPFFILVITSTSFSANETDGLDGLVAGVFLTMFAAYGVIAFDQNRMDLVVFIGAIIGSLVAFLWYNIYPARFFMGDTGSMSLGVVLGVIAMLTETPLLLLPIGIIFVVESFSVIIQLTSKRFRKGKKVFLSAPIHHHFEAKGWPESRVTMRFWMISALGAIIGLLLFLIDSKIPPVISDSESPRIVNELALKK